MRSRIATASSIVFRPNASSATPGMGKVRLTEPAVTTTWSYERVHGSPRSGVMSTTFAAWSMRVTFAVMTRVRFRCLRWSTTAWRASTEPPTTSGRNGW